HERATRERELYRRWRVVRGDPWEKNLAALLDGGPIDLVCFTGDAADWGKAEEFEAATNFFHGMLERLNVALDRFFLIPGNHDIDRSIESDAWQSFHESLQRGADHLGVARWMAGTGPAPLGFDEAWREAIVTRQSAYRTWVREALRRPELDPSCSRHGTLGYTRTIHLSRLDFPIHIIGLDTAWLCGQQEESGRLRLTDSQVLALVTDAQGAPLPGLRLALMHHPLSDLADGTECRRLLAEHVDFVLRGHLHETELEMWADPDDRRLPHFATGCLYEGWEGDRYPNACQVVTLNLDSQGHPISAEAHFRAWSPRGHWHDDDSRYRGTQQGRLVWQLVRERIAVTGPVKCYDPWNPAKPPRFVGRLPALRRLEAALQENRSVSIVGDRRIGKSSVLETWAEMLSERGRIVRCVSGEGPEGASIAAFVAAVTGSDAPDNSDGAADALSRWAAQIAPEGLPPSVLVDELDGMLETFEQRFFERLRGMLGRISFVVATRDPIDLIYRKLQRTSPWENRLELIRLGLLEQTAAAELIEQGRSILDPSEMEMMDEWCGRHALFLQLLGRHLVDAKQYGDTTDMALDLFQAEADARLRELWRALSEAERQRLKESCAGQSIDTRSLKTRGLISEDGRPFGRVLSQWVKEMQT
ncbi:MAG: metallophosphoesterase, partial [Nitrococcus sp.]|nr:metallophosphoesterase [Nitrococcus sp.]